MLGEEAVEVLEETSGASYFTADVRGLSDEPGDDPTLAAATLAEFKALAEQVAGAPTTPDAPAGTPISYAVAGALELPVELKQSLLENRSEPERLELVRAALAELRTQLDRQKVASERAHTNGKVIQS